MNKLDELKNSAEIYAEEIYALESLFEIEQRSQIENQDENDEIAQALQKLCQESPFESASACFYLWLNQTALSLEVFRNENQTCAIIEILRACGGDRVEFVRDTRDGNYIEQDFYSEGATIKQRIYAPNLSAVLDEFLYLS